MEYEGAVYHVMARGHERRPLFRDDHDRQQFPDTLAEMVERFGEGFLSFDSEGV